MTSKFSIDNRELLQRISSGEAVVGIDFGNLIVRDLAAFRLAAMDSEPVSYTDERNLGYIDRGRETAYLWGKHNSEASDVALYAVPQLAPVVPGKWIPVSEQMPEDRTQVILWDAEIGEVTSGHYSHKTQTFYHCGDAIENEITHWMAPPAAPQEVRGE
ncbi:DUF551 domain-containing protein [Klebsiella variicola]|uniref:DUF551 domain-containing protein n=1 Tax=Klebsiella variicola TaxID=244366 RepID=UPI00215904B8|nr:DUF551 domain-containing protein [Klebsiella variicola]MCR8654070.1 DUF551 domain-containing protein [Klebsiella variicola]